MDRRLKERLIGAAVLVALGVWIIPWVLDGRQDATPPSTAVLELPAPNEMVPVRTETLRLDIEPSAPPRAVAAPAPAPVTPAPAPASPTTSDPPAQDAPAPAPTVTPAPSVAATAPAPTRAPEAEPKPERVATPTPASPRSGWMVQLGSFGEEENARRLAERVKTYGYNAEVSAFRSSGRVMHRVRLGPEPSRAEAEALAHSLGAHGFVAQVLPSE